MKKTITTTLLTLTTAFGFAQDVLPEEVTTIVAPTTTEVATNFVQIEAKPALPKIEEKVTPKNSFSYIRMGVSDSKVPNQLQQLDQVTPGIGIGYRISSGFNGLDVSGDYNYRTFTTEQGKEHTYRYTLPKANYVLYVTPSRSSSLYAAAGAAWGGIVTKDKSEFHGLIPNVAVGYEMNRKASWRTFVQVDVSQPVLAAIQTGDLPGLFAEVSVGAGF